MRNSSIAFFILIHICSSISVAQNAPAKFFSLAEAIPPSPTAYSFTKYGDIPVNAYTGSASFEVPLWTVTGKELATSVSLGYHSGGIKVQEEASWVGLGWNLSAGGSITRSVRGLADETAEHAYESFVTTGDPANSQSFLKCVYEKHCDAELDVFVFNISGVTGKFVVYRGKPYLLAHRDVTIKVSGGPVVGSSGPFPEYSFEIIDNKGVRYLFGATETVEHNFSDELAKVITNSWFVSAIISANSLDTISFHYAPETIYSTVIGGHSISYSSFDNPTVCGGTSPSRPTSATTTRSKRLTSIVSSGQQVIFKEQGSVRADFQVPSQSYALDSILVWDKYSKKAIKKFKLIYAPMSAGSHLSNRLTLMQVDEVSRDKTQVLSHKFVYDNLEDLPPKNSFSVDHWGYYNGKSNPSLVPRTLLGYSTTGSEQYVGDADREPDSTYNKYGLLSKIIYPTGGSTDIKYQSNTYRTSRVKQVLHGIDVFADANDTVNLKSRYFDLPPQQDDSNMAIRIGYSLHMFIPGEGTYPIDDDSTLTFVQLSKIPPNGGQPQIILRRFTTQGGTVQVPHDYVYLVPGRYRLVAHVWIPNSTANLILDWAELGTEYETVEMPGPGVRVKRITQNPNTAGYSSVTKSYLYLDGEGEPSGQLTGRPLNYMSTSKSKVSKPDTQTSCEDCNYTIISSNSMAAALPSPDYQIFYSHVSEIVEGAGRTDFTYQLSENDEAQLRVKSAVRFSNNTYTEVSNQNNTYSGVTDKTFAGIVIDQTNTSFCTNPGIECTSTVYSIHAGWNFLTSTSDKLFDDNHIPVTKQTRYFYSNNHRYARQIRTSNSDGTFNSRIIKYPQDYNTSVNSVLLDHGMTGAALEEQTWLKSNSNDSVMVAGQITEYDFTMLKPKKLYQLEINAPVSALNSETISSDKYTTLLSDTRYKERILFSYQQSTGQLINQSQTDNVKYSYLYDYFNMRPIAQVINCNSDQIAYTSFEADQKGNWSYSGTPGNNGNAPTGKRTYTLSAGSISKTLPSGTSYMLSFWYAPGASVQVTGGTQSSITTTAGLNGWTLSKRIVTGGSLLTISGSGGIDELRLHPVGAQMTTYTYEPLLGQTSVSDPNNMTTYFEYDNFGRLKAIYDNKKNMLKRYTYHYKDQILSFDAESN